MKHIKLLAILFISTLTFTACSDDDETTPEPEHEEELITTMKIELTPESGNGTVIFTSTDLDGDGGEDPKIVAPNLAANTTYKGSITLLNENESPADNITDEVKEEAEEHQFFYIVKDLNSTFTYTGQKDANNNPIGIDFELKTGNAGTGSYTFILRHEPNKTADGVSNNDITNAGGETDIEAVFGVTIE
ncbi:type 1 periplasmic binding fold superfamily protein [Tenacibaculum sp. C7A-26P2]|uniref:type 1 periplasmic binding fold superfamily protein n=1 Tax=Tenacibaculum sp. C7A-26P2 TaxID=3447504 RepID=UPI003F83422C